MQVLEERYATHMVRLTVSL